MIWLTLRQHRAQLLTTAGLLAAFGALLLVSGIEAMRYLAENAPEGCPGPGAACAAVVDGMGDRYELAYPIVSILPLVGPALVGAFWGVPLLAREYERGSHLLAWGQSVTVKRWLSVKLAVLSGAAVLAGAALSAMTSAWLSAFDGAVAGDALANPGIFNVTGLAPAAWWLCAFALGAALGAAVRRTLPAMAATVVAIVIAFPALLFAQAYYAEPIEVFAANRGALLQKGGIVVSEAWVDPQGRRLDGAPEGVCPALGPTGSDREQIAEQNCLTDKGYRMLFKYHPPERFWRFQWTQAALLAIVAAALVAFTVRLAGRPR